jgi:DsbC/DsbD-like thiol-disulfide interchange protein
MAHGEFSSAIRETGVNRSVMKTSRLRLLVIASAFASLMATHAIAADASDWDQDARAGVRLIAGNPPAGATDGTQRAGIEIKLASGWKTYWRYPGDSGVPPRFDFKHSENVKSVTVLWPAPHRFSDEEGQTIGYKDHVVFPLRVIPQDKSKPVTLKLDLDYAVCDKLCVPMSSIIELPLDGGASKLDNLLAAAEARIPAPGVIDSAAPGDGKMLAIKSVHRDANATKPQVVVDVVAPRGGKVDLLAEGPTPDWALPLPKAVPGAPAGEQRFTFDLDGLPTSAKAEGADLTLTAIAGEAAIEVKARLD